MSEWKEQLRVQMQIRRAILLYGNVKDTFYENRSLTGVNIAAVVADLVKTVPGTYETVLWNPQDGIVPLSPATERKLRDDLERKYVRDTPTNTRPAGATHYDLGENTNLASGWENTLKAPEQYFQYLEKRFSEKRKGDHTPLVFILDGMDFLFGNADSLSEKERYQLLSLSKAIRDSDGSLDSTSLRTSGDILILLTGKLESIPHSFYADNPAVRTIHVPLPDRKDRENLLRRCCTSFRCQETLLPGTPVFEELVDSMEGYTFRDISQLIRLSRTEERTLPLRKLVSHYRYGLKSSPWEDLSKDRIAQLETVLKKQVVGQDHVLAHVAKTIRKAFMGLSGLQHSGRQQRPKGIFFFVGPTGVGKTETAKALARFLFLDEEACIRFDMSEYNHEHSDQRLVGSPPGYVGYEEGGQLTNAVRKRPFSVLLFDEIEKANKKILDKFLQILEDGRLTDGKGETVSFSESIIIFTSNIGAADVTLDQPNLREWFQNRVRESFVQELKRPELLNRIGVQNILPFDFLTDSNVLLTILKSKLGFLRGKLQEKFKMAEMVFQNEDDVLSSILENYDFSNGGRGVANRLEEHLFDPLSEWLFPYPTNALEGKTLVISRPQKTIQFTLE